VGAGSGHASASSGDRWKGWLFRTAQREAWRLNALHCKERDVVDWAGRYVEQADPPDRYEERHEFQAALQELRKLPPRLPEVVMIRSQESKKDDVAQIMGISRPRVAKLLVEASACRLLAPPPQDSG
jgi:DNA-directed RNA polymerase specialized sigma24 family protein